MKREEVNKLNKIKESNLGLNCYPLKIIKLNENEFCVSTLTGKILIYNTSENYELKTTIEYPINTQSEDETDYLSLALNMLFIDKQKNFVLLNGLYSEAFVIKYIITLFNKETYKEKIVCQYKTFFNFEEMEKDMPNNMVFSNGKIIVCLSCNEQRNKNSNFNCGVCLLLITDIINQQLELVIKIKEEFNFRLNYFPFLFRLENENIFVIFENNDGMVGIMNLKEDMNITIQSLYLGKMVEDIQILNKNSFLIQTVNNEFFLGEFQNSL